MATAVNEMIRRMTPVRQFSRTATEDCQVAGVDFAEGESCVLWYPSAHHSQTVFVGGLKKSLPIRYRMR